MERQAGRLSGDQDIVDEILYMIGSPDNYSKAQLLEKLNDAAEAIDRLRTLFRLFCESEQDGEAPDQQS